MPRTANALNLLHRDHQHVLALLRRLEKSDAEDEQRGLCERVVSELRTHNEIEEQVFYPYLREATAREDLFQEASIEHHTASDLLDQLPKEQLGSPRFKAAVKVLTEYVEHHVKEEEGEIFPQVERTGVDLQALGEALEEARHGDGAAPASKPAARGGRTHEKSHARTSPAKSEPAAKDDERYLREHAGGLSRSTQRAKWIHGPNDRPERDGQTLATRSLEVIRAWAEARGGRPATSPGGDTERPRVLRVDFPDYDERLQEVSWEAWGSTFKDRDLVFLFQETKADGKQSNFFRLDSPEREDA